MVAGPEQVRVLVVSASPYVRYVISGELGAEPDLFVVGTAQTPDEVDYKHALLRPDLVVVDLDTGHDLRNLQRVVAAAESPVVVLSPQSQEGARLAFAALEAGATDVVARAKGSLGEFVFLPDLRCKVRGLARVRPRSSAWPRTNGPTRLKVSPRRVLPGDYIVFVSLSTGGIGPLLQLLADLPPDLTATLLVQSSLPECYVPWFLRRVSPITALCLQQARDGWPVDAGVAYFAPHNCLLGIRLGDILKLESGDKTARIHSLADENLASLAARYGPDLLAVILSGVGDGGIEGALAVREAGGSVVVQEPTTCVANETPQAVIAAGAATIVLPPEKIAGGVLQQVRQDWSVGNCGVLDKNLNADHPMSRSGS